jgi:hypothetical protein
VTTVKYPDEQPHSLRTPCLRSQAAIIFDTLRVRGIFSPESHEWLESVPVICFSCADRPEVVRHRICQQPVRVEILP